MRDLIDGYRGDISTELDEAEIQQRILNAVAAEANLILDKQIVGSRYDIDLCIVNGFSSVSYTHLTLPTIYSV